MCRSIKVLRSNPRPPPPRRSPQHLLQFVRKVSGYRKPSKANQEAFDAAVREIAATTDRLLHIVSESYPVTVKSAEYGTVETNRPAD